ncbi:hypothetical protein [Faecalispora jeddahensis]|uniref:hypothetical protein n=1 Tax=Faecalispora jeddahensis TaxID=1414721 RepID=UPI00145BBC86|nr:hypothetical protein [Faecalispora jeddahensis]
MKTVKKYLSYYIGRMSKSFQQKKWIYVLALILLGLIVSGFAGFLIWQLCRGIAAIISFVYLNGWTIAGLIVITIWGVAYIKTVNREKLQRKEQLRLQQEELVNAEQQRLAAQNHIQVRQIIFDVLQDVGRLVNLEPPTSLSSLDAPVHFTFQNGTLFFYYAVLKQGTVDCQKVLALLQDRLQQKALANELGLQPTSIVFRGVAYPIIMVDKVTDMGSYIELRIAWASEAYLSQRGSRGNFGGGIPSGRNDDNDF